MQCPECGRDVDRVTDTRPSGGGAIRRRRECDAGHRFTTYEIVENEANTQRRRKLLDEFRALLRRLGRLARELEREADRASRGGRPQPLPGAPGGPIVRSP